MEDCKFCNILNNDRVKAVSDTILFESQYFFVIPALGCIVKNYIMIISKRHITSMCYLNDEERKDLEYLVNEFRSIIKGIYGFYPVIFEHGASEADTNKSACCVLHAHMHIVPHRLSIQSEMINRLSMNPISSYNQFYMSGREKPYLFFMDNAGSLFFRDVADIAFPSQIFRKWIAKDLDLQDKWDWQIYPYEDNILATVDELKPVIRQRHNRIRDKRLKYIYYCRAMDGLCSEEIKFEYAYIKDKLTEQGRLLVNPFIDDEHNQLELNDHNAKLIVQENLQNISKADCVIVNLSLENHTYVGCIAEMVYAKMKGCYVIVVCGNSGVDKHFYTLYHSDKIYRTLEELFSKGDWLE